MVNNNVLISFKEKKKEIDGCEHNSILVDADLWEIECAECHEKLNPIEYLIKLAQNERLVKMEATMIREQIKQLSNRVRTKCQHCGKMTRI